MRRINNIYDELRNTGVNNIPELNEDAILNFGVNEQDVLNHYQLYLQLFIQANSIGPIEKHPYIDRFIQDFDLNRKFLILGTMPPSSYFNHLGLNGLPNNNINATIPLDYYYGNMASLGSYLQFGDNLTVPHIRNELSRKSISITDVFAFVQRTEMKSTKDSDLYNLVLNENVLEIFALDTSTIDTILTTSGSLQDLRGNGNNPVNVVKGLKWLISDSDLLEYYSVSGDFSGNGQYFPLDNQGILLALGQQQGGIVWWLKRKDKKVKIINLPSPSGQVSRAIPRTAFFRLWVNYRAITNGINLPVNIALGAFFNQNPEIFAQQYTSQYRQEVYDMALNDTLDMIYQANNLL